MNKKLGVTLCLTFLFSIFLIQKYGFVSPRTLSWSEPATLETATTLSSEYSLETQKKALENNFPKIADAAFSKKTRNQPQKGTYTIPGLKATLTLMTGPHSHETMCTMMTPQGVTVAGKYLVISAYCHTGQHNSVLFLLDLKTHHFVKEIILQGHPHVGGVTYDPDREVIWACGRRNHRAELFAISLEKMKEYNFSESAKPITYEHRVLLPTIQRASFVTYNQQSLYVGFFNIRKTGTIQRYKIDATGKFKGNIVKAYLKMKSGQFDAIADAFTTQNTIDKAQGIAFYHDKVLISQSYGTKKSRLYVFKREGSKNIFRKNEAEKTILMPAHLEQTTVNNQTLLSLFESAARPYQKFERIHLDHILPLNLPKLVGDEDEKK